MMLRATSKLPKKESRLLLRISKQSRNQKLRRRLKRSLTRPQKTRSKSRRLRLRPLMTIKMLWMIKSRQLLMSLLKRPHLLRRLRH
jgi:hypothetical protein